MANRSRQTFIKRQKERARQEKQRLKAEKRAQRKEEKELEKRTTPRAAWIPTSPASFPALKPPAAREVMDVLTEDEKAALEEEEEAAAKKKKALPVRRDCAPSVPRALLRASRPLHRPQSTRPRAMAASLPIPGLVPRAPPPSARSSASSPHVGKRRPGRRGSAQGGVRWSASSRHFCRGLRGRQSDASRNRSEPFGLALASLSVPLGGGGLRGGVGVQDRRARPHLLPGR